LEFRRIGHEKSQRSLKKRGEEREERERERGKREHARATYRSPERKAERRVWTTLVVVVVVVVWNEDISVAFDQEAALGFAVERNAVRAR